MKNVFRLLRITVLVTLFGMAVVGCSNGSTSLGGDSRLVLEDGYAWIRNGGEDDDSYGFIFKTDGTYNWIHKMSPYGDNDWVILNSGTWSTSGNNRITLANDGEPPATVPYTMTDITFTYTANNETWNYIKKQVTMR